MRLALSVFKDCISTVFDAADKLLIIQTDGIDTPKRFSFNFSTANPVGRATQLKEKNIDVLICGAISKPMQSAIISQGITVHPFIKGQVTNIVAAYQNNQLEHTAFLLPGCRRRAMGAEFGGQRRMRCRWRRSS